MSHAQGKYRKRGKDETDELSNFRYSCKALVKMYGRLPAKDFTPKKLKAVRQSMIDGEYARRNINSHIRRIKQVFAWAVEEELIPGSVHHALSAVKGLRKGRSEAKEKARIKPAKFDAIKAVMAGSRPEIVAMIRLQLYTGMRPGEVCRITPGQVDRSRKVWVYRPERHKTADHEDDSREIYIGKKAQAILAPWLLRDADRPCFIAALSRTGKRNAYTVRNYQQYIERVCERDAIDRWSPNQLRHNAGTRFRRRYGLEIARVLLGHKKVETTQIYAEQNKRKAFKAMKKLG
jgi:integrase